MREICPRFVIGEYGKISKFHRLLHTVQKTPESILNKHFIHQKAAHCWNRQWGREQHSSIERRQNKYRSLKTDIRQRAGEELQRDFRNVCWEPSRKHPNMLLSPHSLSQTNTISDITWFLTPSHLSILSISQPQHLSSPIIQHGNQSRPPKRHLDRLSP